MSIRKNTWNLDEHYDLTKSGQNVYSSAGGPYSLYGIGNNGQGSLGQNDRSARSSPAQIPGTWISAGAGFVGSGIKNDNTLWSWGYANFGGPGLNDVIPRSSPVQVPGTWKVIVQPNDYYGGITAFKTDGTLWAWGRGEHGKLGQNDIIPRSSPVQIPGTQWSSENGQFAGGGVSLAGMKTDGSLWAWGYANSGRTGLNSIIDRSSPVQIPGTWSSVSASYYATAAKKSDGTLWVWGYNEFGSLGLNDRIQRSSPIQLPGAYWNEISSGTYYNFLATKTDGTLWAWGYNGSGSALGLNDAIARSSPTQLPGTQWTKPMRYAGYNASCQKTDGTLWVWGNNGNGTLGQNDGTYRSSPIQLPGTGWTVLPSHRSDNTLFLKNL
jgi:alpha-tubulin suppressor-like RCC1 family protein